MVCPGAPVVSGLWEPATQRAGHGLTHDLFAQASFCGFFHVTAPPLASGCEQSIRQHKGPIYQACVFDGMSFLEEWHSRHSPSQRESLKLNSVFFKGTAEARCIRNRWL